MQEKKKFKGKLGQLEPSSIGTGLGIYYVSQKHNVDSVRLRSNKIPYSTPSPVLTTGEHKGFIPLSTSTNISCSINDHNI